MPRKPAEEERAEVVFKVRHDATVEQSLVAAALVDRGCREKLSKMLPRHDKFHSPQFAACWAYVLELERLGLDHDPALLSRMVGERVDGEYLAKLLEAQPDPPADLKRLVDALLWDDVRVRAARGPASLLAEALVDPSTPREKLKAVSKQLAVMFDDGVGGGRYIVDGAELVRQNMADLEERIAGRTSYPFGIKTLDYYEEGYVSPRGEDLGGTLRMIPGTMPKGITVIAGNTGAGKTTIAVHAALGIARQKRRVLYCAWEPAAGMTAGTMAAISLGWSLSKLQHGYTQDAPLRDKVPMRAEEKVLWEERQHAILACVTFMDNPFYRSTRPSNAAHLDLLQEHVESSGADAVFCDLWERLLVENNPGDEKLALFRQQSMAKELSAHFFLLAQNKKGDVEGARPSQGAVTGTGGWAQIADNLLCPYRPGLYKNVADDTLEIHVLKQRYGVWPQVIELPWDPDKAWIGEGRTIPYQPPGSEREEGGLGAIFGKGKGRKG